MKPCNTLPILVALTLEQKGLDFVWPGLFWPGNGRA